MKNLYPLFEGPMSRCAQFKVNNPTRNSFHILEHSLLTADDRTGEIYRMLECLSKDELNHPRITQLMTSLANSLPSSDFHFRLNILEAALNKGMAAVEMKESFMKDFFPMDPENLKDFEAHLENVISEGSLNITDALLASQLKTYLKLPNVDAKALTEQLLIAAAKAGDPVRFLKYLDFLKKNDFLENARPRIENGMLLHQAASVGNIELIKEITSNFNFDKMNTLKVIDGQSIYTQMHSLLKSPLLIAIQSKQHDAARFLAEHTSAKTLSARRGLYDWHELHQAIAADYPDVVETIVSKLDPSALESMEFFVDGISVQGRTHQSNKFTALTTAISLKRYSALDQLIDRLASKTPSFSFLEELINAAKDPNIVPLLIKVIKRLDSSTIEQGLFKTYSDGRRHILCNLINLKNMEVLEEFLKMTPKGFLSKPIWIEDEDDDPSYGTTAIQYAKSRFPESVELIRKDLASP